MTSGFASVVSVIFAIILSAYVADTLGRPMSNQFISVWADGSWCYDDELSEMTHKSDDFFRLELPDELSDQEIDQYIATMFAKE